METKPIWASKTFWGTMITFASPWLTKWLGVEGFDWSGIEDHIVAVVGAALAVYGRWTAVKGIA